MGKTYSYLDKEVPQMFFESRYVLVEAEQAFYEDLYLWPARDSKKTQIEPTFSKLHTTYYPTKVGHV